MYHMVATHPHNGVCGLTSINTQDADHMNIEDVKVCGRVCLTTTVLCDRDHVSVLKDLREAGAGSGAGVAQVLGVDSGENVLLPLLSFHRFDGTEVIIQERPRFSLGLVIAAFARLRRVRAITLEQ